MEMAGTCTSGPGGWNLRFHLYNMLTISSLYAVNQFFVSGLDIDGDGNQLHEFQSYYKIQSFTLDISQPFLLHLYRVPKRIRC